LLIEQTQHLIYKALSNLLLLPWPNTPESEQKWEAREEHHRAFVKALLRDFDSLVSNFAAIQSQEGIRAQGN